jgi:pentatricopeptide repeat protein
VGGSPQLEAYNEAIYACGKASELETAEKLLQEMTNAKISPNNMSYRGIIKGLVAGGDAEKCVAVIEVRGVT